MTIQLPATPDAGVRQRLLQAALDLFTARGYAATTVREIVETAGVTKPVLYYYFGNKEGLYLTLLNESFAGFDRQLDEFVQTPGPARDRLLRYCRSIFDNAAANVDIVRLSHAIYFGPPQGAPHFDFEGFFQRMLDGIAAILDDGLHRGEFRPHPRHELTWAVMGILNICMQEQIFQCAPRIDGAAMEVSLTLLLNGIAAGDSQ